MRLLLGSGGFRTAERVILLDEQMRSFFGRVRRVLFIPYAQKDHGEYLRALSEKGLDGGYPVEGIDRHDEPGKAVREAEAIYVGGGNTFRLLAELYRYELLDVIRERVAAGVPYLGISAGTNVACPTIQTTNDMPITWPARPEALGLVPFQINPHYFTGQTHVKTADGYREHFGETRDDRVREFHEMNERPVVGLWEGGMLRIEGGRMQLVGAPARIFRRGQQPVDVAPSDGLAGLLACGAPARSM